MKRILSFLLLFVVFFTKIISGDGAPKPSYDLTIYVEDKIFKIESSKIENDKKISEIIKSIGEEIKKIPEKRFYEDNGCIDDDQKNKCKEFRKNFDINNYSLEKFKKDDVDHYFLEFYEKTVKDYNNIVINDITCTKDIYLIEKIDHIKNYEIVIEDTDIYNENIVGFTDNVKKMIKTIPFELDIFTHKEILKTVLEKNRIFDNFVIGKITDIDDNKIKLNIKINEGKEGDCYKKIKFKLELTTNGVGPEEKGNSDVLYKVWKDKITNKNISFDDIKTIFKEDLKDIHLFEKEKDQITYNEEGDKHVIELKYSKEIKIQSIKYISTNKDGNKEEDEKLYDKSKKNAKPITVYTDCDNIYDFLYKLSSLLNFNIYENYTLKDNVGNVITKDENLSGLSKIEIDQDNLKVKYVVNFNDQNKELYFSEVCDFKNICRLLVHENSLANYELTNNNKKKYNYYNNEKIPNVEGNNLIKYTLVVKNYGEEKNPVKNIQNKKIAINNNTTKQQFKTVEDIIKEQDEISEKNNKITKSVEDVEKKKKNRGYC